MKKWKIVIDLKVSDNWIEDGFDMSERIQELENTFREMLPYAYSHEVITKVKITSSPKKEEIQKLQGYL